MKVLLKKLIKRCFFIPLFLPLTAHASFIETTMGTAVLNDATASYYNPAALVLIKNPQIVTQGSIAFFRTHFSGQATSLANGLSQTGSSSANTHYYSPSVYLGVPASDKIIVGLAIVTNSANRDSDENSILRYVQANNNIEDYDVVPALAYKINEMISVGAGVNLSYANFQLYPITNISGLNVVDSQSTNQSDGTGVGGNVGFLLKPSTETVLGFDYRSVTTYRLSGKSIFQGPPAVTSNNYRFHLSTPARSIFSINHFFTAKFGLIGTVQYIQWNTITSTHVYGIATASGSTPLIVDGVVPQNLRNTWLFTLGSHYRITPAWILRVAATYNQSPGNPYYQITTGDSIVLGASTGYEINKIVKIDGSYAHAFIRNQNININGARYLITGVNQGSRDGLSLKLTFNV